MVEIRATSCEVEPFANNVCADREWDGAKGIWKKSDEVEQFVYYGLPANLANSFPRTVVSTARWHRMTI